MVQKKEDMNENVNDGTSHMLPPMFCRDSDSVALLIKNARQRKRLTQKELAALIGITAVQLCRIENDECVPSRQTLQKLSGYIGVPYSELLIQAGYNNMKGDDRLYKRDGSILDVHKLVNSIYRADSDFLSLFYDFETIGTEENVEVIRILLKAMRKEAEIQSHPIAEANRLSQYFSNFFVPLKRFIVTSLIAMTE